MTGNRYSVYMANVTPLRDTTDPIRTARAAFVHDSLKSERWSVRQAALATGIGTSVLATRMSGTTAFLADELESIAALLKRDPVEFYAEYLAAKERPSDYVADRSGTVTHVDFTARKVVA